MTHVIVLTSGVLLTLPIFWSAHFFIGKILQDDYWLSGTNSRQIVNIKINDFQNTVNDAASYFEASYKNNNIAPSGSSLGANLNMRAIDSLLWIPIANPKEVVELKSGDTVPTPAQQASYIILASDVLQQSAKKSKNNPFLYIGNSTGINSSFDSNAQSKVIGFIKPIRGPDGYFSGYIAALTTLDKVLSFERNFPEKDVSKTIFWQPMTKKILFAAYNQDLNFFGLGEPYKYSFPVIIADTTIGVQITYKKSSKNILLESLPYFIGLFGFFVTIIAWLYVSQNYKKSKLLSVANDKLANKNDELNDQIREREKLFQILRKSERENHAIVNAISDVIFEILPSGEILFLNEAWTKITGFDIETSLGENIFDVIYPPDKEEQKQSIISLSKGLKTAYRCPTKLRTIEGTYRSVELVVSMLRQDDAKKLRVVGSFTDMEERERAEHALNEAEKKYKTIWQNAAGGIYQISRYGKILSANPSLARIFAYETPDSMMAVVQNAHEELFIEPAQRNSALKECIASPRDLISIESLAVTKKGEQIWVRENFRAVFDETNTFKYYEGSIEDVTAQKNSEVQLKEAKVQSDMASRAKSEFLANISHELRTPLNSIIGFSEIIRNEVFGPIQPDSYKEYAANIYDSGKSLLSIINQILDISRIDAGERELNESLVDVRKIATLCLDLTRSKITQASLTIIDTIPENLPKLIAEEVAVKQMILNLLSNAAKFTANGGRITLSAEIDGSGRLRISITDTGVGLSAEQIERSSKPFGLVDGRLDKGTGGAGLGLSLVHALLKLHGGKLEIMSQKGIGTTASLIFPAARIQA